MRLDLDAIRFELRAAAQCVLAAFLQLRRFDPGLDADQVAHAADALDGADRALGPLALVIPLYAALQRDPTLLHDDLDAFPSVRKLDAKRRYRVAGDVGGGAVLGGGQAH